MFFAVESVFICFFGCSFVKHNFTREIYVGCFFFHVDRV